MTTPVCPCCGAKFQHDAAKEQCKKCGLPDELIAHSAEAVQAWKAGILRQQRPQRKAAKRAKQARERVSHKSMYRKLSREKRHAA